jgi:hypothetical protein
MNASFGGDEREVSTSSALMTITISLACIGWDKAVIDKGERNELAKYP